MPEVPALAFGTAQKNHSSPPEYFEPFEKTVLDAAYLQLAHAAK